MSFRQDAAASLASTKSWYRNKLLQKMIADSERALSTKQLMLRIRFSRKIDSSDMKISATNPCLGKEDFSPPPFVSFAQISDQAAIFLS